MYILDTANIKEIKDAINFYQIDGVTTNPTILVREQKETYFTQLKEIKDVLKDKRLYVQVTATNFEKMKEEVDLLIAKLGDDISIKIPATKEGFQLMKHLNKKVHITATAICSYELGLMSIACGANALALYINRMANEGIDANLVTKNLRAYIDQNNSDTKLVGASFKNVVQIRENFLHGVHAVTISYDLLKESMNAKILN
jgi:TalC/MipB family fructose-6-phosphate aldolase